MNSEEQNGLTEEQDVRPCKHMETMVNGYADGSLRGPARWYTHVHAMHCGQCNGAIEKLRVVIEKVSDLREPSAMEDDLKPVSRRVDIARALVDVVAATEGSR